MSNELKEREAKIRQWFEDCDTRTPGVKTHLYRAASFIFDRQTAAEQATNETRVRNNIGFNGSDARFFSWIVKSFKVTQAESLFEGTAIKMKFRLKKYSRQLAEIALDNERKRL